VILFAHIPLHDFAIHVVAIGSYVVDRYSLTETCVVAAMTQL
jgi:hypothetical protein